MLRTRPLPRRPLAVAVTRRGLATEPPCPMSPTHRSLVEWSGRRGHVGAVGAVATGKSQCAAQRVVWLDGHADRRVLALGVAPLDHARPFHALERRGHRVASAREWAQHTLEELGLRSDRDRTLPLGALTALVLHHADALPLRAFHHRIATGSSALLRRTAGDLVRCFTTLEAHGVRPEAYAALAGDAGDESHEEMAGAYAAYRELQRRHDVRSWDGLVLDLLEAFARDPHCLKAATGEFSDVVVDDLDRLTPAMVQVLALVVQQPHIESSMSFSHCDELVTGECARLSQLHDLLGTVQPEIVRLPDEGPDRNTRAGIRHVAAQVLTGRTSPPPATSQLVAGEDVRIPELTSLEAATFEGEANAVATLIRHHQSSHPSSRITVFCPTRADVDAVSQALLARGIRVDGRAGTGSNATRRLLFDEPGVDTLFSLLVALWSPSDTKHLYNVLRSEFVAFPPHVLSRLMERQHRRRSHATLTDVLTTFVDSKGLELKGVDDVTLLAALQAATTFSEIVRECRDKCHSNSVAAIVQLFLERVGHLDRLLDPQTPRDARQAIALAALLREIDAAQRVVQSEQVPFVVPYLMQLKSARIVYVGDEDIDDDEGDDGVCVLPLTRYDLDELDASSRRGGTDDTAPNDGLVVLTSMRDAKFPGRLKRITWPLPKELMAEPLPIQTRAEFLADAETLVYDALVQLNPKKIVISYAKAINSAGTKKEEKLSRVLEPLWTTSSPSIVSKDEPDDARGPRGGDPVSSTQGVNNETRDPAVPHTPTAFEPSHLSYSQIAEYTRCPHQYYLSRVLGLRELAASADDDTAGETNLAMMFGSAVHEAVAAFGVALQRGDDLESAEHQAFRVLEGAWHREGFLSMRQEAFFLERARSTLRGFVRRHDASAQILAVERTFDCRLGRDGDVALRGVWDRVDRTADGDVLIREFKTNPSAQRRTQMDSAAAESLQLQIYLVAYEQLHGEAPRGATLEVLEEDGEPNAVGFVEYSTGLRARVDETVDATMAAIRRGEFGATPSFMACSMCPYASSVCRANVAGDA